MLYRRVRGDLIEAYKILTNKYGGDTVQFLNKCSDAPTRVSPRNHPLALIPHKSCKSVRENSFSVRIVKMWNALPEEVVLAPSTNAFKNRLDKHFHGKDIVYNFDVYMTSDKSSDKCLLFDMYTNSVD